MQNRLFCIRTLLKEGPLDLYRLVLGHEALHYRPGNEVCHTAEAEHYEISCGFALEAHEMECGTGILCIGEEVARNLLDYHRANAACHSADTGDGSDGALREHVTHGAEEVRTPGLMSRSRKADEYGRPPWRVEVDSKRLGKESRYGEEGEDEHCEHASGIGIHALLVHKDFGEISSKDGHHRNDRI